jgi:Icc-related predicted phosphoesterase
MPRLAVIGDVHAHFRRLSTALDALASERFDGVLLVGDLGNSDVGLRRLRTAAGDASYLSSVAEVLDRVSALGRPLAYVPGNHDLPELELPGNADHRVVVVAGVTVAGVGGAGPDRFGFCYEWTEDDVRRRVVPAADVLLVHCPPRNTPLDLVPRGEHVGSEAIREIAETRRSILVCGHIHESPGACRVGDTLCLNAGGLGRPYGRAQLGFVEIHEGGADVVEHLDLETGVRRRWSRESLALG